jgi:transcriptional regulator with XRE-family HTH domain
MVRDWLIAARERKGLSQQDVSKSIYVAQPSYCNIEHGTRRPSVDTAKRIADVLDLDWTLFFEDDKEKGGDEG